MQNDSVWKIKVHSTVSSEKEDRVSFRRWPRNARKSKSCCVLTLHFDGQSGNENGLFNQSLHFIIRKYCFSFSFSKFPCVGAQSTLMHKQYLTDFYTSFNLETWITENYETTAATKVAWVGYSAMMFLSNQK